MNSSNYPNGFEHGVVIREVPYPEVFPGPVVYVDSSAGIDSTNRGTFRRPYSTLDYALSKATASKTTIFLMPGFAETHSAAGAISFSEAVRAGTTVVGLGNGSLRPTFTFNGADTSTITVGVANVTFKNCIFTANFADVVAPFTLTSGVAARYLRIENCYFKATAANMNFLYLVDTSASSNGADGLALIGNKWIDPDLLCEAMVKMDGTNSDISIIGNEVNLGVHNNTAALMAIATTKIVTNLKCGWNKVYRLNTDSATGGLLITTDVSTNTGWVYNNTVQHADTAAEILVTASSGLGFFENRASGVAGATGYVLPAVDS